MPILKKHFRNLKYLFLDEFSSIRLAVTLFVFLAITTLIGTVLPEEPMVGKAELIKKYGLENYRLLKSFGLTDVFHSWWYLTLLFALWINLIVASFRRVFPKRKIAFAWPVDLKEESLKSLSVNCEVPIKGNITLETFGQVLKKNKFKVKINDEKLLAVKGGWHRLGASVTHVGILLFLCGCLISVFTGFNGMAQVLENEGFYLADLGDSNTQIKSAEPQNWLAPISKMPLWIGRVPPYLVKINKTWKESYKEGLPKQWYTDLSVYDQNKKELARKTIFVNSPLEFMGLDIYQSNWGKFARIAFDKELATLPLENFRGEETTFIPLSNDVGLKFVLQETMNQNKPEDFLKIYSVNSDVTKEKFLGKIPENSDLQVGPIKIGFLGVEKMTGLQFKSDPGSVLIYPALFLIVLGVFISFGSRKQIWAYLTNNNKMIAAGESDRAKRKFFGEFENLIKDLVVYGNH